MALQGLGLGVLAGLQTIQYALIEPGLGPASGPVMALMDWFNNQLLPGIQPRVDQQLIILFFRWPVSRWPPFFCFFRAGRPGTSRPSSKRRRTEWPCPRK